MSGSIRQLEERQLATEVTIMRWSPKMDLLAVANKKGEVALHRLTWQRVWSASPPEECETVSNLFWRPDGKLLAVSYSKSKSLHLIDIENKNIIHKREQESKNDVTSMTWLPISSQELSDYSTLANNKSVISPTGCYLPSLPSLNRTFSHESDRKEFLFHSLDILFLGHEGGEITIYVFGMFYCGTIKIGPGMVSEISGGLGKSIWVTCKANTGITVYRLSCSLLEKSKSFLKVAQMQANINYLMDYLSQTLMAISEAWETILLEMDEKLTRYEEDEPPGTLAADFLELLMIGISSNKLATFLLHDLSDKGLKKLGHSIELCYSNIQKLVLKHLNSVGMALVYQLSEIRGMARFGGDYELLGLTDEIHVINATHAAEAFLAKSSEIQQVIDHSMKEYKAFFRWLYVEIAKLTDEKIPSEASKISQQELSFIAEFLLGFDTSANIASSPSSSSSLSSTPTPSTSTPNIPTGRRKGVNLEKLGQYLRREKLKIPLSAEGSEWAAMLDENKCLNNHSLIVKQDLDLSLLLSYDKLLNSVDNLFTDTYKGLVNHFSIASIDINLVSQTEKMEKFTSTQIVDNMGNLVIAMTSDDDRKTLKLFKVQIGDVKDDNLVYKRGVISLDNKQASFSKQQMDLSIIDLQFYSANYISLLVLNQNNYTIYLIQLNINDTHFSDVVHNKTSNTCDESLNISQTENSNVTYICDLIGNNLPKSIGPGVTAARIFVSGQRKVAAILSDNNRKVRLLETEVEPDDDDDDEEEEDEVGQDDEEDATSGKKNKNFGNSSNKLDESESSDTYNRADKMDSKENNCFCDDSLMETSNNIAEDT